MQILKQSFINLFNVCHKTYNVIANAHHHDKMYFII